MIPSSQPAVEALTTNQTGDVEVEPTSQSTVTGAVFAALTSEIATTSRTKSNAAR
jgi:hypothetical protein